MTIPQPFGVAATLLRLQRSHGNRHVRRLLQTKRDHMIELPREGVRHPALDLLESSDVRFRVPTFADLKAVFKDPQLKIPESVVKERVAQLLGRMKREKRLKSAESIPDIMKKIFPSPGVIDETAFKAAVDVTDRTVIYQSVLDANTKVKTGEKARLRALMADAAAEIVTAEADATGLTQVFGSKAATAKGHYAKARRSLGEVSRDMNSKVTTDYNLDDQEVFLGGWANFGGRHMHLLIDVVKGTDEKESKSTLIHEASHLADSSILDNGGYYGTQNFEAMPESAKVANAAHYEEIPRRQLGISIYKDAHGAWITFTPGFSAGGGAVTWEDNVKKAASDFMQAAWDAAVDVHTGIRAIRHAALKGNPRLFTTHKTALLEISKLMDLTIHSQDPAKARVTPLDVTLAESIARGVGLVGSIMRREKLTRSRKAWSSPAEEERAHRDILIHIALAKYGELLSPRARSMKLLEWLAAHLHAVPLP